MIEQRTSGPAVRVVTQNLFGRYERMPDRQPALRAGLRALRPDLVAFQEAISAGDHDQALDLLGSGYYVAHQTEREADGSGISIGSRWPILDVHEHALHVTPRTADFPVATLAALVDVPGPVGPLLFVNHKPSYKAHLEHERELQAVAGARFVAEVAAQAGTTHVVLAGDQDAVPESASIRFWCGRQSLHGLSVSYIDAWDLAHPGEPGHTHVPGHNPLVNSPRWPAARRIDYIFVRCNDEGPGLRVVACERILDEPVGGVWPSDHFGVMADLELMPGRP